jgi:hypothetical protein
MLALVELHLGASTLLSLSPLGFYNVVTGTIHFKKPHFVLVGKSGGSWLELATI